MFIQHFQVIRIYPVMGTGEEYGLSENPALFDMYIHLGQEIHADVQVVYCKLAFCYFHRIRWV